MDSVIEARRAKFEAAMDAADKNPGQWLDGQYQNQYGQAAWIGYNAALDSLVVELPEVIEGGSFTKSAQRRAVRKVVEAIEKAGVRTK
jgi:hypothetical protein